MNRKLFYIWIYLSLSVGLSGQGFLHTQGKLIVDGSGENFILRGIGTGNWMLQEGYMMQTAGVAGTQHEFRSKLLESVGEVRTDSFYSVWLENHCRRIDIDSMASWGFNSVRVAMHYKWFTLPIDDEPVPGENTWLSMGFVLIDSLLEWCGDNQMYLILDLHGAPGGQGTNADISDYDSSKPSLWESQENRDKTIALWAKLAERYSQEPWIGGYDLINETNWTFPEGNNYQLRLLFGQITNAIRAVDQNHMIIIEGNWFANDFSRLTPPWDNNMVYSFHKYWSYNHGNSLDWVLSIRDTHNVPLWLGEAGENSNTWFTNLISLCEGENVGWSWWPLKKPGINNPLQVVVNPDYTRLIESWKGNVAAPSGENAFQAVLEFADNHKLENCIYHKEVIDAMIRQPHSNQTLPFGNHTPDSIIYASDFDLGRIGYAYFDRDSADYHLDMGGLYTAWNKGWTYRNDGVDIQQCSDIFPTNGYNVAWTEDGEWLQYTISSDTVASYCLEIRSASGGSGSQIYVEINGVDATGLINLPGTGDWQKWTSTEVEDIILPAGRFELRFVFHRGGSNISFMRFKNPKQVSETAFQFISACTPDLKNEVNIALNKPVTFPDQINVENFVLYANGNVHPIDRIELHQKDDRVLTIFPAEPLFANQNLKITYKGSSIQSADELLLPFNFKNVDNRLAAHHTLPGQIQAEEFYQNKGLEMEPCFDTGGGLNSAYANPGDYLDYVVYVEHAGEYTIDFRIATEKNNAELLLQVDKGDGFETLKKMEFSNTGGWQNWETRSTNIHMEAGKYLLRLQVAGEEHNLNWFQLTSHVGVEPEKSKAIILLYPNPAADYVQITPRGFRKGPLWIEVFDGLGRVKLHRQIANEPMTLDMESYKSGLYFIRLYNQFERQAVKLQIERSNGI